MRQYSSSTVSLSATAPIVNTHALAKDKPAGHAPGVPRDHVNEELPEPPASVSVFLTRSKKVAYGTTQSRPRTAAGDESSTCLHATQTLACMVRRYSHAYPKAMLDPAKFYA